MLEEERVPGLLGVAVDGGEETSRRPTLTLEDAASHRTSTFGTFVFWFRDLRYGIAIFGNTAGTLNSVETLLSRGVIEGRVEVPKDRRIGVSGQLKKEHQNLRDKIVNAFDALYTERRSPRLPPTKNTTHLACTNLDPGYGTIQLKETTDPEDAASTVLVGSNRSGIIINSEVLLRHVPGGYWVLYLSSAEVPLEMGAALAAELKFGSDANASALKIIWDQAKPGLREVKVLLNKVE
ncbi:hypothetical protein MHUMG1_03490 [Metarhizium humberi]|uniref:Uncharacterized protein n=1 Tax=Metarhizium humberi TaxID=2596975 RepID=A0A9P8MB74_9HYPO|nr:hypothetical protein MHUMG1_03490 [Metarhizium humberi]